MATATASARRLSIRTRLVLILALIFLVFAVYSRSLAFQFILDDHRFTSDPRIREWGHIWEYFANFVWAQFAGGPNSFYRPVFLLWLRINFVLTGLSPWGWHFLSISKHLFVALLLGLLIWRLLADWISAFVGASLFALHPAQTESVSWVTVPDPLMAAGLAGSLLFYLAYVGYRSSATETLEKAPRRKNTSRALKASPLWLAAATGAYFAALLTKETAIVFLPVIFLSAFYLAPPLEATATLALRLRNALLHSVPFLCATAAYLLLRFHALGKLASETQHLSWRTQALTWPAILWFYVKAMLWPVKSYSFADPILIEKFSPPGVLFPLAALAIFVAALMAALFWAWRKAQREFNSEQFLGIKVALVIGTSLLILPLLPALNLNALNPGDFLHGRYTYLPIAGLMLLLATAWRLLENIRVVLLSAAGAITALFVVLTLSQEMQWQDDATVFATAHRLAPNNAPVARNLADTSVQVALQLQQEGRCNEAIPMFEQVIQNYPDDWYAWAGRGVCYAELNDLQKAEESLHRAANISHNPRVVEQWQALRAHMGLPSFGPKN
ncbi:MAG TPA: tetratricopeptide repeat protein [Terriglobales bacterium]|nr:tetratricopeptide repeat protein [Terriglobales bacterium]